MRQVRYVYLVVMDAFYTFLADDGWAIASHIALSTLMAIFPFLIVVTALAGLFFGSKELADEAARILLEAWPKEVAGPIALDIAGAGGAAKGMAVPVVGDEVQRLGRIERVWTGLTH